MYNHLLRMLDLVGKLSRVALENMHAASEASTQATGRGGRGGGSRGREGARGHGGGRGPTLAPIHSYEDEDKLDDVALEGDWDMYMDGVGLSRCTPDATVGPSHLVGHDDSVEHTSYGQASPRSPPPTQLSPPLFSDFAHKGGYKFLLTPGRPTPPIVQAKPTQEPSLPNPDESATQIEQIRSENIEPVHGL